MVLVTLLYYLDFFKSAILLHIKTVKLNFFFNLKGQASCFSKRKKRSNRLSQEKRVSMMPLKAAIRSHVASAEKRSWARQSPQCFREIWFCTQREWTETGVCKRTLREVVTDGKE